MEEIIIYKCPNCTADLVFNKDTRKILCKHCDSAYTKAELNKLFNNYQKHFLTSEYYDCISCGAKIFFGNTIISQKCPYCGNNIVKFCKSDRILSPDKIILFNIDKKNVENIFLGKFSNIEGIKFSNISNIYIYHIGYITRLVMLKLVKIYMLFNLQMCY